ncbi:protein white-like [Macrobrachium nipponense]|uniref:protein white-like n=1 Tax=Macrobrachium nipponense TaxID=159736 RepID=UPI0030C8A4A1
MVQTFLYSYLKTKGEYHKDYWRTEVLADTEVHQCVCQRNMAGEAISETSLEVTGEPEPITYSWNNINVFYTPPAVSKGLFQKSESLPGEINILKDVTGICRPGELLAIMGSSGAGKTTLLNVLNHRNTQALTVTGDLFVNGERVDPEALTGCSAYVQQDDMFLGSLTVREQLIFQALLRMDKFCSYDERIKRVDEVILELGLFKCQDTLIGVPGKTKSISGGEMKRLSFGCELLTNPSLLFCDEPTSGLDSFMAQNVVAVMKQMAEKGKTVITTIHQPSSEVFGMFDRLLLMAEGRVAFLGEMDEALAFFRGLNMPCPDKFNPSDFFIDQLSVEPGNETYDKVRIKGICASFAGSKRFLEIQEAAKLNQEVDEEHRRSPSWTGDKSPYKASWCSQFSAVLWRAWLEVIREPFLIRVRFFQLMAIAILVGFIYMKQNLDQIGVHNINGALFLLITNMTFQNCTAVINTFCAQKHLFLREHLNGMYRTDVYFLAKNLVEWPFFTVYSMMYTSIVYFLIGLNPDLERFFMCVLISVLTTWTAVSFGHLLSCLSSSVDMALTLMAPLLMPLMLFGGFFLNTRSTPVYLRGLKYLSWFHYGNEALVLNQWTGVTNITCSTGETCYADGEAVITRMGYDDSNIGQSLVGLACLIVGFRLLAYFFLLLKTRRSKTH